MLQADAGEKLQKLINDHRASGRLNEAVVTLLDRSTNESLHASVGSRASNGAQPLQDSIDHTTPFFLASATKLFAASLIFQFVDRGTLALSTPVADVIPRDLLAGLNVIGGKDRSTEISIEHLLAHTSGLADYFEQRPRIGEPFAKALLAGTDATWSVEDMLDFVRTSLRPKFAPGASGKAFYSDTNYQLLGVVIEHVLGKPLPAAVFEHIAQPLGLKQTGLFLAREPDSFGPVLPLRNAKNQLHIPHAIESTRLDGGGVSTSAEFARFISAFFSGELFSPRHVQFDQPFRRIFFPLRYGTGVMRFALPWFFSPFRRQPDLFGHSGISGAFGFICPHQDLIVAGTTNQLASRSLPYRLMLEVIAAT